MFYKSADYIVIKNQKNGEYLIKSQCNNYAIGLTWSDEITLNGKEADFYVNN